MYIIPVNFRDILPLTCTLFPSHVYVLKYIEFDNHDLSPPVHSNKYGYISAKCRSYKILLRHLFYYTNMTWI